MIIVLNAPREASRGFLEFSCLAIYNTVPILWTLYASISPDLHHFVLGSENQPCFACLPCIEPQPGQSLKAVSWDARRIHCFVSCLLDIPAREGNGTPLFPVLLPGKSHGWRSLEGIAKDRTRLSIFTFTFQFHALEKEMANHSSVLAWRIPGMGSLVGCRLWGCTESDTTEVT